jgi:hypothetical protein
MKNSINSVLKSGVLAILLAGSVLSIPASVAAATISMENQNPRTDIKRVVVSGNTKVLLIQGGSEYVKIDDEQMDKVKVTKTGSTLNISSSESYPITVMVYVKDIYRITASEKASVRTAGKFKVQNLQVILKDNARAAIKASTQSLYTAIDGNAKLKLMGTTANHISKTAGLAKIDTDKFAALKTEEVNTAVALTAVAGHRKSPLSN